MGTIYLCNNRDGYTDIASANATVDHKQTTCRQGVVDKALLSILLDMHVKQWRSLLAFLPTSSIIPTIAINCKADRCSTRT